ncbi:MAG TPA: hypothetical protein VHV30_04270 [Polyangiaceae bacterium]|jgi:hypothetical protein|nr:hypothetical protein [Polyangiaceae bacterium]
MFEVDAPSSLRALEKLHDPLVRQRLDEIAARITAESPCAGVSPPIEAGALLDHALARIFDPELDPWNEGGLDFIRHVSLIMARIWIGRHPSQEPLVTELREALADDPLALRAFDALGAGVVIEDLPALLGCTRHQVIKARRRFLFMATFLHEGEKAAATPAPAPATPARSKEDPR